MSFSVEPARKHCSQWVLCLLRTWCPLPAVTLLLVFLPQVAVNLNWWKSRRISRMEGRFTVSFISKDSSINTREGKMITNLHWKRKQFICGKWDQDRLASGWDIVRYTHKENWMFFCSAETKCSILIINLDRRRSDWAKHILKSELRWLKILRQPANS